jgi:aminobenzoyl-glutamate transport protein
VPENGVLRDMNALLTITPFLNSIVALMMFIFLIPGIIYGVVVGKIKSDKTVAEMMADSMSSLGSYIVLAFVAAHFVAFFNWSNLGVITAINGAEFLSAIGFSGIPLLISFLIFTGFINLFIGSASAKWALMAPIFVPMLMLMGLSPEITQATYRLGDSFTNIITPLMAYFPLVIIYAQKYQKDLGIGTLISLMLPYSIMFLILSIVVLVIWVLTGIPVGPDSPLYYNY